MLARPALVLANRKMHLRDLMLEDADRGPEFIGRHIAEIFIHKRAGVAFKDTHSPIFVHPIRNNYKRS